MDQIREAIERAKAAVSNPAMPPNSLPRETALESSIIQPASAFRTGINGIKEVVVNRDHLDAHRIIAHHAADPRSKAFDMLRTQVLQTIDLRNWQIVAVTSPTAGCGKTLTAMNLAFSIARQPERAVFLLDLDLHKPQVANCLGLQTKLGVVSVLEGRASLADATIQARAGSHQIMVLPTETRVVDSSELISSRAMGRMLQDIKRNFPSHTLIIDLPPILSSDDVIALLPQIDCVLLVAAVGTSTVSEIKECHKHLQSATVLRIVLNKASEQTTRYY